VSTIQRVRVIDSHTGGEPTRVVLEGAPDLGSGPLADRARLFREQHDRFRSAVVNEPRGSDIIVGALLCPPVDPACAAGVIFFNNVGVLGMCGHGTIGLIVTLAHLGRIGPGEHRIETPVGEVKAVLHADGRVAVENVPSRRTAHDVALTLADGTLVRGDVAWGGNWFFLAAKHGQELNLARARELTDFALAVRAAAHAAGFPDIDHVELFGPPTIPGADSRSFVLCPGGAYDRSPCGTGTSAKLACLAAAGQLAEDAPWVQESICGSTFTGTYRWLDQARGVIAPTITGTAHLNAEATLLLDPRDPLCWGVRT
jgi:proline racemase